MIFTKDYCLNICRNTGAANCAQVAVSEIIFDPSLRKNCELNYCGQYGKTWVCPPNCGPIDQCIKKVRAYNQALIIQTISPLEDSYDFEGMDDAMTEFHKVLKSVTDMVKKDLGDIYILSAGGCRLCERCAFSEQKPCRNPENAFPSLESHGIFVADLAPKAGMKYINGKNTVTYFGAVFFNE